MALKRLLVAITATLGLLVGLAPMAAHAQLVIDINKANLQPVPIAIPALNAPSGNAVGADIARVVSGDLQRSGLFRPLDPNSFIERNLDVNVQPRFEDWKTIGAQVLINGQVTVDADGRLHVDFRLWNIFLNQDLKDQQMLGLQFTTTPENWRRVAHKIADAVYERLTGEKGYFDTRVVFVSESGPKTKRVKRLTIMDQDWANPSFLTNGSSTVMTPRFSSSSQEITYMSLTQSTANIYLFNIETGRQESLGRFPGMVFAPRFSPDGGKVAFSVEQRGNSDVYVMDLRSRQTTRLTFDPSIDTSPSFSPDGKQIVFNSDRGGSPQLYVMNADGSGVRRISNSGGRYTTPVWSPRGDYIAFTKQTGGEFHIGVMKPDGSDERLLTGSFLDEGPTWAPNGRVLMFFRDAPGAGPRLWTVDITGRIIQEAPYPGQASDPAWSPLLN
ncbi:MAG: Tol-Pal system beta propeller repeat protein TolB [Caulobacteraceae bacterium]